MSEELTAENHNTNREILQELCSEAPPEVGKIIKTYNYDEEGDIILKEMSKFSKKELIQAAEYLQNISTEENKSKLVTSIINRIDSLLLEFCRKCTSFYHVKKDEIPSLICNKCGQGVHDQCYKEITKAIYNFPGIIYLCAKCESPTPKVNVPTPTIEPSSQEDNLTQTESQVNPSDELIDQTICPKYRRGICPHGISGLTKVDNKVCEFYHPKRCMKLCIYGPHDEENGCNKGHDCELFHQLFADIVLNTEDALIDLVNSLISVEQDVTDQDMKKLPM